MSNNKNIYSKQLILQFVTYTFHSSPQILEDLQFKMSLVIVLLHLCLCVIRVTYLYLFLYLCTLQ